MESSSVSAYAHDSSSSSSGFSSSGDGDANSNSRTSSGAPLGSAALAANDDDDFGVFAAATAPALSPPAAPATSDPYAGMFEPPLSVSAFSQSALSELSFADDEYDSPFADIVNEPPKSANASRNNSFSYSGVAFEPPQQQLQQPTQASAGGIEMGSPLLSFSPLATSSTLSMAPSASSLPDIFSSTASTPCMGTASVLRAPVDAELLSFSPLALSSSAPSAAPALSSFLLDALTPSTDSQKKPTPRFSLPPPRTVSMSSQSPGAESSTKAASFSGQVSVGELLSFSPVASAPVSSFSSSLGGGSAAATSSIFDDDELFSLSTADLALDFGSAATADLYLVAASPSPELSPVSFGDSMIQDFTVVTQSSASFELQLPAEEEESGTLVAESEVQGVDANEEEEIAFPGQQADEEEHLEQQSLIGGELQISSEESRHAEFEEVQQSVSDDGSSATGEDVDNSVAVVSAETVEAAQDTQRLSIPSPVGYSQFDFITRGFSPQASQSDGQVGSPSPELSPVPLGASMTQDVASCDTMNDTNGGGDEFDGFGAASTSESRLTAFQSEIGVVSAFAETSDESDAFHGFSAGEFGGVAAADDFGDFAQSSTLVDGGDDDDDDAFGDFGDFGQSSSAVGDDDDDAFAGFGQSSSSDFGANAPFSSSEDDFGDFNGPAVSAAPPAFAAVATSFSITTLLSSTHELEHFFSQAFPVNSTPTPLDTSPQVPYAPSHASKELFHDKGRSNELVATIYRAAVESYFQDSSAAIGSTVMGTELFSSELKALRLKHLKYVLTEKIQEASRHDGISPHGSDKHRVLLSLVTSDDEKKMRNALTSVQDSLFSNSVNDAMMRIARQAALSAKAKIAEQAAHQQANSRGSLLATTRQLLSRSGGGTAGTAGGSFRDATASLGVLTPTGASVHKISRFSFAGGHDNDAAASASGSTTGTGSGGEDSGGENDGSGRNSYEADSAPPTPGSGRNSGSGSSSGGSGGGLMKKFQDRFSSFSNKSRPRVVSLRRMGQSGEDVRQMELNMDSISGGLDQVKWKCAVFLYDVDEVAQVAPSQIRILSYPGKEVLAGKSDRSALLKFLKPGAIWTIDIGASNNDVLNEW